MNCYTQTTYSHSLLMLQCRNGTAHSTASTYADRLLLIPGMLEYGAPSHDVWPDNPEWEERQITCDFGIRVLRPGLFSDLVVRLNSAEGRRQLRIVADPLPVFLSHHAVFFAAVDQVRSEADLGMFSMFGRTGVQQKRAPQKHIFFHFFATW